MINLEQVKPKRKPNLFFLNNILILKIMRIKEILSHLQNKMNKFQIRKNLKKLKQQLI